MNTSLNNYFWLLVISIFSTTAITAQNWNQAIKAVASDRAVGAAFGRSIAISGNYAIIGAPKEDNNATGGSPVTDAGAIYFYEKNGLGNWVQVQKAVASDRSSSDDFGSSVAISGNYAIVGAPQNGFDVAGNNYLLYAGAAYIFERNSAGVWAQVKKILPGDRNVADERFGVSVSISNNYAVVGAYYEKQDATGGATLNQAGAVYVFERSGGVWNQTQKVVASDRSASDEFGVSVGISGNHLVVGARYEDHNVAGGASLTNAGSAYFFERNGTGVWNQVQKVVASDRSTAAEFAYAAAIDGNYAVIGSRADDLDANGINPVTDAGSAYIFERNGAGAWNQVQKIVAADRAASDQFSFKVAISGNYLVVGAYTEDDDAIGTNTLTDAGSAYIFERNSIGVWNQNQKIVASDRGASDQFGFSVGISGGTVAVGAPFEDQNVTGASTLTDAGSIYFFDKSCIVSITDTVNTCNSSYTWINGQTYTVNNYTTTHTIAGPASCDTIITLHLTLSSSGLNWDEIIKTVASDRATSANFGRSVAISGSYAIVGVPKESKNATGTNSLTNAGAVYFFQKNSSGSWVQIQKVVASDRTANNEFGNNVAIFGNYAIVGVPLNTTNTVGGNSIINAGAAYIFERNGAGVWTEVKKIVASDRSGGLDQRFGTSVSISNNYAAVGAYYDKLNATGGATLNQAGSAYIFERSAGVWNETQKIVASDRAATDEFGVSIGISGNYVVVGARYEDHDVAGGASLTNAGSAYFFERNGAGVWNQVQKVVASDRTSASEFAYTVAIDGNYAVIGSRADDLDVNGANPVTDAGSAYVFERNGTGVWNQAQKIVAADRAASDQFSFKVAISGNYIVIGADYEDQNASGANTLADAGSAYVFANNGAGVWNQTQKIVASDRALGDHFGFGVGVSGNDIMVSAPFEDHDVLGANALNDAGSVYYYNKGCTPSSSTTVMNACNSYTWIDGLTYTASNNTATYNFVSSSCSCDSIVTLNLTIDTVITTITINGNTLTSNQSGAAYQWIDCNNGNSPILGAMSQNFNPTASGDYAVEITLNNCMVTSPCQNFVGTSMNRINDSKISIYPNPAKQELNVSIQTAGQYNIRLMDVTGRVVLSELDYLNENSPKRLDISKLAAGAYFLNLTDDAGKSYTEKVIIL